MKKYNFNKPLCLIILDGWGLSSDQEGNAVDLADTPNMDRFYKDYPATALLSSGEAVGLPEGQMGNSEVGHLNIGAGRIIYQELTRITKSIKDGDFFSNGVLLQAIENTRRNKSCLHLMGLVSDGGVHSHILHLKALVDMAAGNGVDKVYLHAFLDGRDVGPRSAIDYLREVDGYLKLRDCGEIATVCGRYYSMDRDNRWDRIKQAYDAMVYRSGQLYNSAVELVEKSYENGKDDEFTVPAIVKVRDSSFEGIKDNDSLIFFNFRPDRARQLTKSFIFRDFTEFDRGPRPPDAFFVCMTRYNRDFNARVAFPPSEITNTLGQIISKNNLRQLRVAETEKYAHVTFFFNGGVEKAYPGEDRILIPSPKVATYDLKPEMSAFEVTAKVIEVIEKELYDIIIMNYANPDMVGHTGFLDAAIKAIETVDQCLGRVESAVRAKNGLCIITADHGNAEEMINFNENCSITAHSTSKVPFIICSNMVGQLRGQNIFKQNFEKACRLDPGSGDFGALCDISPTILTLMDLGQPPEMTGKSLVGE